MDGEHEIVATLRKDGVLEKSTTSDKITFTMRYILYAAAYVFSSSLNLASVSSTFAFMLLEYNDGESTVHVIFI
jgi:hypothetical protein